MRTGIAAQRTGAPRRGGRRARPGGGLAVGLVSGVVADALLGDPRRGHPVAGFGRVAARVEKAIYDDSRAAGMLFTAALVGGAVAAGAGIERWAHRAYGARGRAIAVAAATWAVLGSRSLAAEGQAIGALLGAGDLPAARRRLTHLVGRDTAALDAAQIARAAVESIAENTCDATVAPLCWGAAAGVPGLVGYRAANTLDAMVGHPSPRYERFGWAAARLDDAVNLLPARIGVALIAAAAALTPGASAAGAWRVARRDARAHPSPNSGFAEAAFAGALGVRLGGRNVYAGRVEERPVLGDGRPVAAADLPRAVRLARITTVLAALVAAAGAVAAGKCPRRGSRHGG